MIKVVSQAKRMIGVVSKVVGRYLDFFLSFAAFKLIRATFGNN
jgi:hypothetical protein